jgi:hypothetical protein
MGFQFFGPNEGIRITGTETGDTLRAAILAHPEGADYATITGRTMVFQESLMFRGYDYTDSNAAYIFDGSSKIKAESTGAWPKTQGELNFTDVAIRYQGVQKGGGFSRPHTTNFTRVSWVQGLDYGRSDFFNNGEYIHNWEDVSITGFGDNDYMHFQTAQTLNNITVTYAGDRSGGGLNFEPGARNASESMTMNNLKLVGVAKIVGGQTAQGSFISRNMKWDSLIWQFDCRSVTFININPIKPDNWSGYQVGPAHWRILLFEYFTHDIKVVKENNIPVSGATVILYKSSGFEEADKAYTQITDVDGKIPQQEVLTFNDYVAYEDFELRVLSYSQNIGSGTRALQNGQIDESLFVQTDQSLTQFDKSIVDGYRKADNANEVYDAFKAYLIDNYEGEAAPLVTRSGNDLDFGSYDVKIRVATMSGTVKRHVTTPNLLVVSGNDLQANLKTTGTITIEAENFNGRVEDRNGIIYPAASLSITDLVTNSEVRVYESGTLTEVSGTENSGTSFTTSVNVSPVDIVVHHVEYEHIRLSNVDTSADTSVPIQQRFDRGYSNE